MVLFTFAWIDSTSSNLRDYLIESTPLVKEIKQNLISSPITPELGESFFSYRAPGANILSLILSKIPQAVLTEVDDISSLTQNDIVRFVDGKYYKLNFQAPSSTTSTDITKAFFNYLFDKPELERIFKIDTTSLADISAWIIITDNTEQIDILPEISGTIEIDSDTNGYKKITNCYIHYVKEGYIGKDFYKEPFRFFDNTAYQNSSNFLTLALFSDQTNAKAWIPANISANDLAVYEFSDLNLNVSIYLLNYSSLIADRLTNFKLDTNSIDFYPMKITQILPLAVFTEIDYTSYQYDSILNNLPEFNVNDYLALFDSTTNEHNVYVLALPKSMPTKLLLLKYTLARQSDSTVVDFTASNYPDISLQQTDYDITGYISDLTFKTEVYVFDISKFYNQNTFITNIRYIPEFPNKLIIVSEPILPFVETNKPGISDTLLQQFPKLAFVDYDYNNEITVWNIDYTGLQIVVESLDGTQLEVLTPVALISETLKDISLLTITQAKLLNESEQESFEYWTNTLSTISNLLREKYPFKDTTALTEWYLLDSETGNLSLIKTEIHNVEELWNDSDILQPFNFTDLSQLNEIIRFIFENKYGIKLTDMSKSFLNRYLTLDIQFDNLDIFETNVINADTTSITYFVNYKFTELYNDTLDELSKTELQGVINIQYSGIEDTIQIKLEPFADNVLINEQTTTTLVLNNNQEKQINIKILDQFVPFVLHVSKV